MAEAYSKLLLRFGLREFRTSDASEVLGVENPHLILYRLSRAGYLVKVSRGAFKASHPIVLVLEWAGYKWGDKIVQKDYLGFLELLIAKVVENFWDKLISLVIFGSVAAGRARAESDIDLLVVSEGLPEKYSDRLRLWRGIVSGLESERLRLWREKKLYPLVDPILLTLREAERTQPFYLDLLYNAVIVYDRDDFMCRILEGLRAKLKVLGAVKVELPDKSWYWIIKPGASFGEVIEV
ncbi:MAG: nucleotidyltransferase domain-containing protein [Thaumarchaeota archaeon]|nr:nucleotidyltransferase domain-containing protein [Candidatus Geocrenenecus arthurdayi]